MIGFFSCVTDYISMVLSAIFPFSINLFVGVLFVAMVVLAVWRIIS